MHLGGIMKILGLTCALLCASGVSLAKDLTVERLESSPSLNGEVVQGLKISPDGKRITFLRGKKENASQLDLWQFDSKSGKAHLLVDSNELLSGGKEELSEEEKGRRERNRSIAGKTGIVTYFWSADSKSLAFPISGDVYVKPINGKSKRLTNTLEYETDIKFSPKGSYVSFVREREIYAVDIRSGKEIQLTQGATETIANGMAEFVAQEELERFTGYWWSPDETRVAFEQFDEAPVLIKDRYEVQPDGGVITIKQRYPEAGTSNVDWRIGIVSVDDLSIVWPDIPAIGNTSKRDDYLGRLNWSRDSRYFVFQQLNREQTVNRYVFKTRNGETLTCGKKCTAGFEDQSDIWINLTHDFRFLNDGTILLTLEGDDGFRHIVQRDAFGEKIKQVTSGDWPVDAIQHVNKKKNLVYFTGFKDSPLEKHLYSVSLKNGSVKRITQETGWHSTKIGKGFFVDNFSSPKQPPQVMVKSLKDGSTTAGILENSLENKHPYAPYVEGAAKKQFGTLTATDGSELHYLLYLPPMLEKGKRYPAVMAPYGGPHGQRVTKAWRVDFNEILARKGYVVMVLDNRGMWNRGKVFEGKLKNAMGTVEIEDQVLGANHLKSLDFIDRDNVGFWGWSYGGYMTLMALFKEGDTFKSGVSIAPVTDWRLYDTAYTERYLGHPNAPGGVYNKSSVFPYIDGYKGKLLLIHGMADDNVFFDHSVKLMSALQARGKQFELMTYPGKKHGIRGAKTRAHLWNQTLGFFERTLKE